MLPNIGYGELILILGVGLLFFGAKQIPEIARSFGKAINSFKAGMKEMPDAPQDEKPEKETPSEKP
ncbi:MAG: twin-arginine translocase TatA/TatE family subunit [Elusimicrobiota bacterium]